MDVCTYDVEKQCLFMTGLCIFCTLCCETETNKTRDLAEKSTGCSHGDGLVEGSPHLQMKALCEVSCACTVQVSDLSVNT